MRCTHGSSTFTPMHTSVHANARDNGSSSISAFCYLLPSLFTLFTSVPFTPPFSHTSTGGPSLVGIHQGPSLSPAMLQRQWTITGYRRPSLLMSSEHVYVCVCVCGRGWDVCAPMCTCFNHAYYICINISEEMQVHFCIQALYGCLCVQLRALSANVGVFGGRGGGVGVLGLWSISALKGSGQVPVNAASAEQTG